MIVRQVLGLIGLDHRGTPKTWRSRCCPTNCCPAPADGPLPHVLRCTANRRPPLLRNAGEQMGSTRPPRTALNSSRPRRTAPNGRPRPATPRVCAGQSGAASTFTPKRSLVRSQYRPHSRYRRSWPLFAGAFLVFNIILRPESQQIVSECGENPSVVITRTVRVAVQGGRCLLVTHDLLHVVDRHAG
jgi:hypothetical protein